MAITADQVVVKLEVILGDYNRRIAEGEKRFTSSMSRMEGSASRIQKSVGSSMRSIAGAIGLVSTIALARGLLSIADEAKNLDAQLRLATSQTGNFGQATEDVRRIAEATRSGLSDTAGLYGNFQRNARDLGITQAEAARATETFAKTLKISGAGAAESSAAIRQFSQALASGVLRGDEFNSIMENAPRLARLLADSLGVPVGALRAMAEEGELTASRLTSALTDKKFTAGIDAEFKQLPVTFDQAMQQVYNAAIITFGAFDQGGQFSTALANFITQGTGGFAELEQGAFQTGREIRTSFEALHNVFGPMVSGAFKAFGLIGNGAASLRRDIASLLGNIDAAYNRLRLVREGDFSLAQRSGLLGPRVPRSTLEQDFLRETGKISNRLTLGDIMRGDAFQDFPKAEQQSRGAPAPAGKGKRSKARSTRGEAKKREPTAAELRDAALGPVPFATGLDFEKPLVDIEKISAEMLDIPGLLETISASIPDIGSILPIEEQERLERFAQGFTRDLSDGLAGAIVYGDNLGDVLINSFKRAAAEALSSGLADILSGRGASGGFFGTLASGIGSLFGGKPASGRASGGHVQAGQMYRVNETGVEGFQPAGSGKIIPLGQMKRAGGGGTVVHQTFVLDARHGITTPELLAHVNATAERAKVAAIVGGAALAREQGDRRARKALS